MYTAHDKIERRALGEGDEDAGAGNNVRDSSCLQDAAS